MTDGTHIVIIGGGFAGTQAAKCLAYHTPDNTKITLISQENYITFNPMLAEVVGASILPGQVIAPIRQMLRRGQSFVMGRVDNINLEKKVIHYNCGLGHHVLPYDQLVFSFGVRANSSFIPGMEEHGIPLKLVGDALRIRNQLMERLEQAEQSTDPEMQKFLCHFIVVGGGFSGVEVAGEIADFIRSSGKYFPSIPKEHMKVTIVHKTDRLLPELPEKLGLHTQKSMKKRGINVLLGVGVSKADERGVEVHNSETDEVSHIDGSTIISTIGTKPNPLIEKLGINTDRGKILTNPDMSVQGQDGMWAIGDCALIANEATKSFSPPTAQFAVQEAKQVGRNVAASLMGKPTKPFSYDSKGTLATIGHLNGVAKIYCVPVSGLPAWLLWRGFYLSRMPTLGRKVRVFVEWTWAMLFPVDITHLRFTASNQADRKVEIAETLEVVEAKEA